MKNFTYFRPNTPQQAVSLLEARWGNTELLAGGTDLLALQKEYIASPATLATSLIALGASAEVLGPNNNRRTVAMTQFFHAPTGPNEREHALAANELVTSVTIPVRNLHNASYEVRQRQSSDWPIV